MVGGVYMNGACASSNSLEWKKVWPLRSGEFATVCDNCGVAYKQLIFCEMFHSEDTGWRECTSCGKRLHCGCIASNSLLELLDTVGVNYIGCSKSSKLPSTSSQEKPKVCGQSTANDINQNIDKMSSAQSGDDAENECLEHSLPSQNVDTASVNPKKIFLLLEKLGINSYQVLIYHLLNHQKILKHCKKVRVLKMLKDYYFKQA